MKWVKQKAPNSQQILKNTNEDMTHPLTVYEPPRLPVAWFTETIFPNKALFSLLQTQYFPLIWCNSSHLALWAPPNKGGTYITLTDHWPHQRGRGCTVSDTLAVAPNPRRAGQSHFLCHSLIRFWKSTEMSATLFWINVCVKTNKEFTLSLATFNGKISHMDTSPLELQCHSLACCSP